MGKKITIAFTPINSRTIILVYRSGDQKKEVLSLLSTLPNSINTADGLIPA